MMDPETPGSPETRVSVALCAGVVVAGGALRFALAWSAPESVDLQSYDIVADLLRRGLPLYEGTHRYNYAPLWAWILDAIHRAARFASVSPAGLTRSLLAAGDLACAWMAFRLARRKGFVHPWAAAAAVAGNPVLIWVSSVQGQFDNLSILLLLVALDAATVLRATPALFLSLAVKQVTAVHPLLFLRRREDVLPILSVYAGTAALFLPYASQWRAIRDHVLLYRAVPRSYGLSELVLWDARFALPVALIALAAATAAAWRLRFAEPARASLFVFLVLLALAPGLGSQYFVWPLVVGALFRGPGYILVTIAALVWVLGSHFGVPGSGQFFGQILWLAVAFWTLREARVLFPPQPARVS
jgi:hypothetical protein